MFYLQSEGLVAVVVIPSARVQHAAMTRRIGKIEGAKFITSSFADD